MLTHEATVGSVPGASGLDRMGFGSFMLLVVRPGAPSSFLFLVAMHLATSSFLLLVVRHLLLEAMHLFLIASCY